MIADRWEEIKTESARQGRSIFETSSLLAVATLRALPATARRLSASARVGAKHTGKLLSQAMLDDYERALRELRQAGYLTYAKRQLSPYVRACVEQFSPQRRTLTQRAVEKVVRRPK